MRDEDSSNGDSLNPGGRLFDFFQLAISQEFNKLSDEQKAEYEKKALEWRVNGPSDDVKRE